MQSVLFWGGLLAVGASFVIEFASWFTVSVLSHASDHRNVVKHEAKLEADVQRFLSANEAKGRPEPTLPGPEPELAPEFYEFDRDVEPTGSVTGWGS
ncbi:hypothetical protein [Botrimarina mediterranea]|uniref:hypothetical protein n=1 Tax=Botrimarina mediterranea TaxID=2528022 RepID=UPI001189C27C|nr:hypothetical protein K2D_29940 [Planctomycetes bacterium K2D]